MHITQLTHEMNMCSVGFKSTIPAAKQSQTNTLDYTATIISVFIHSFISIQPLGRF